MRTTLCTFAFLFSLSWSLNGHLTKSQKNTEVTNTVEDASGQGEHTTDSKTANPTWANDLQKEKSSRGPSETQDRISPSSVQTSRVTVQQSIHNQRTTNTSNQRTTRKIQDGEHNLISKVAHAESSTTPQKELGKLSGSSHKPYYTSLQKENASEFNVSNKPPGAMRADEKDTSRGPSVSLSRSFETQDSTSYSEQQSIGLRTANSEDVTSNKRTKRNIHDGDYSTTVKSQITQDELTTQKEQDKATESSHKPHSTSALWIKTSSEIDFYNKPPSTMWAEEASSGPSETHEGTQKTSTSIGPYSEQATAMENNTNDDLNTIHSTMVTTDQPIPVTQAHTSSTIIPTTNLNTTVSIIGVKTTERYSLSTQGPELVTSAKTKSTKKLMTTRKANKSNPPEKAKTKSNPGPAVAAVIGTTFVLMLIAIIFILVRKQKMQKRQLENPEWAGPSPFLDGDVQPNLTNMDEPEGINRQGFSQMSDAFARYLPNRLSKHLTLGRNTSDEVLMGDIMQGTTFGRQNVDEVQPPNGNTKVSQDPNENEQNKIQEDQEPVDSSNTKTNTSESTQEPTMDIKEPKQTDDVTVTPPSDTDTKIKHPPPLVSIDLDSLSEEAAPFQTSDGGIAPPAPPLP